MKKLFVPILSAVACVCLSACDLSSLIPQTPQTPQNEKTISSLEINGTLTKTKYSIDEVFDPNGLTTLAKYSDNSSATLSYDNVEYIFTPKKARENLNEVTVYSKLTDSQLSSLPKTYSISIKTEQEEHDNPSVISIEIKGDLNKKNYNLGQSWASDGLYVEASLSNSTKKTLTSSEYTYTYSPDKPALGVTSVSITAKHNQITSNPVSFNVTVTDPQSGTGGGTSTDPNVNAYYASITNTTNGASLKTALYNLIKTGHEKYGYDNLEIAMRTTDRNWELSPDPNDENPYMNLLYMVDNTSTNKVHKWDTYHGKGGILDGNKAVWNKEHIWAKSNGFPTENKPAYSDLHHLRASDKLNNGRRSNYRFGNVSGNPSILDFNGDKSGKLSNEVYEPIDRDKGDVARALFYMATRYSTGDGTDKPLSLTNGHDASGGEWGELATLKQWHLQDPPDEWEIHRNTLVQQIQGNRNPFIDHPEWVSVIWGN